jgi:hypothetical protein
MKDMMSLEFLKKLGDKAQFKRNNIGDELSGGADELWPTEESGGKSAIGSYQSGKQGMELMEEQSLMRVLAKHNKASHG